MNGKIIVNKFDYPLEVLPLYPLLVDELPGTSHFVTEPKKGVEIHYDLTIYGDQPPNMLFFIQKLEEDLQEIKKLIT